jgi:hypothetical protein
MNEVKAVNGTFTDDISQLHSIIARWQGGL